MRQTFIVGYALVMLAVAAPSAWAQDPIHKLGRGVTNVVTCWIELPKQTMQGKEDRNPVTGVAKGFFNGLGTGLLRFGVGLYETFTFPLPYYPRDYASPYEFMELPDYPWE